jgi:hypothetical protein
MNETSHHFVADRVWDGVSAQIGPSRAVTFASEKIVALTPDGAPPKGEHVRIFEGCTILPGLIDAHVHYGSWMGRLFLAAGVTTIRDVGSELAWILEQRRLHAADPARGPGIVCCGKALNGKEGPWRHVAQQHPDVESLRRSVREHVAAGVDQIKLYAFLDREWLAAGIAEAREHGMTTLSHLGMVDAADAVRDGLNQIEHQTCCAPGWPPTHEQDPKPLIDCLLEREAVLDPTFVVWDRLGRVYDLSFRNDARRHRMPKQWIDMWDRFTQGYLTANRAQYAHAIPHLKRFFHSAISARVTCALGTDTPFPHLVPGTSVHDELAHYVDAGVSPIDALRCATSTNAQVIGKPDTIGRIAPGYVADLLIVRGDPTRDIRDIANVVAVVHRGRVFDPAKLLDDAASANPGLDEPIAKDLFPYVTKLEGGKS